MANQQNPRTGNNPQTGGGETQRTQQGQQPGRQTGAGGGQQQHQQQQGGRQGSNMEREGGMNRPGEQRRDSQE